MKRPMKCNYHIAPVNDIIISFDNTSDQLVKAQLNKYPNASKQVLYFIFDMMYHEGEDNDEVIRHLFHNGYCYYFANMLKLAFNRGEVCWAAPFGHFVWKDDNGICYDIEGVTISEAEYYIPVSYIEDGIKDFLHIRDVFYNASQDDISRWINNYLKDIKEVF